MNEKKAEKWLRIFAACCLVVGFGGYFFMMLVYPTNEDPPAHPTPDEKTHDSEGRRMLPNPGNRLTEWCVNEVVYYSSGHWFAPKLNIHSQVETCE